MDEMLADLISEGTLEGLEAARARGRTGGRKTKLTTRQVTVARQMYDEKDADGKRRYTVAEIAETFNVSRKTIYRHLEPDQHAARLTARDSQVAAGSTFLNDRPSCRLHGRQGDLFLHDVARRVDHYRVVPPTADHAP